MTRKLQPCGTEAAYQWHRRRGEDACAVCLAAHRTYQAQARSSDGGTHRRSSRIRSRALYRLKALHPADYARVLAEEYAADRAGTR
jgi:hypothetical protein